MGGVCLWGVLWGGLFGVVLVGEYFGEVIAGEGWSGGTTGELFFLCFSNFFFVFWPEGATPPLLRSDPWRRGGARWEAKSVSVR